MVNIPHSEIFSVDLYNAGAKIQADEHNALESTKLGTLRGGNSGALVDGEVLGKCHRISLARYKGISTPKNDGAQYWFDAGYANEEAWLNKLSTTIKGMEGYELLSEEECPIKWSTSGGIRVTGRPDFVIFKDGVPNLGLELKVVCTEGSAAGIWCAGEPSIANLIQTAHYSMIIGCPFNLVYSYRASSIAPRWVISKHKDRLRQKSNKSWVIDPFIAEFRVGFENDQVYYIDLHGKKVVTPITSQSIRDYYELIVDMDKEKELYTRVATKKANGDWLPYDQCNYCPFSAACENYDSHGDYQHWLDEISILKEES
jgi:hypothetical protein